MCVDSANVNRFCTLDFVDGKRGISSMHNGITHHSSPLQMRILTEQEIRARAVAREPNSLPQSLKPTDCLALAKWSEDTYISSPNSHVIPAPGSVADKSELVYYDDGMMDQFELFKWPQAYDPVEPHGMAAPASPAPFVMRDLPFERWTETLFVEVEGAVGERVGILAPPIWDQLDFAAQETTKMAQRVCDVRYPSRDDLRGAVAKEHNGRSAFIGDRLLALAQAVTKLKEIPMVRNDVLAWFREVQRLLQEVRAWMIYEKVLVPRLQTPQHRASLAQVLPVRGVITSRITVVEELERIGVPVWWMRSINTLTDETVIWEVSRVHCALQPLLTYQAARRDLTLEARHE